MPPSFDPMTVMWQAYFTPPTESRQTLFLVTTRRVVTYTIEREATETIEWAHGAIETERWHRRSDDGSIDAYFWLAPKMHYALVKMRVTHSARGTVEAVLDAIRVDEPNVRSDRQIAGVAGSNQLTGLADAIARVARLDMPADAALSAFFRTHPEMGQHDRAFVSDGVFAYLRRKRSLEALAGGGRSASSRARRRDARARPFAARSRGRVAARRRRMARRPEVAAHAAAPTDAVAADLPDWLWQRLRDVYGETERAALTRAWHARRAVRPARQSAEGDARRRARSTRRLRHRRRRRRPTRRLAFACTAARRSSGIRWLADGRLEVQDEGSQLIGYLVAPRRARHGRRLLRRRGRQDAAARRADALAGTPLRVRRVGEAARQLRRRG